MSAEGTPGRIRRMASGIAHSEWVHGHLVEPVTSWPEHAGHGVVGGIVDATAMNVLNTVGDAIKPFKTAVETTVAEPVGRTALAVKELVTGHPFKAVSQEVVGAKNIVQGATQFAREALDLVLSPIDRIAQGTARAALGVLGEDINDSRYGEHKTEKSITLGVGMKGGAPAGGIEGETSFWNSGGGPAPAHA